VKSEKGGGGGGAVGAAAFTPVNYTIFK